MRKILFVLILLFTFSFIACNNTNRFPNDEPKTEEDKNSFTITFIQKNEQNIVRTISKGSRLLEIPIPKKVERYTVVWDKTDDEIKAVKTDAIITAVFTPNEYTITYKVNTSNKAITMESNTQKVIYNQTFDYLMPHSNIDFYYFKGWYIENSGEKLEKGQIYKFAYNITVIAKWE